MSTGAGAAVAFLFGSVLGSFFNVVAHRLPKGESLVTPGSRCPRCETPIKAYDNLPILGWLLLRGRCRSCGEPISPRYPVVELITGLLFAAAVLSYGADRDVWLPLAFLALLVPVTLVDLDTQTIPNKLMIVGAVLAPAILLATDPDSLVENLIAAGCAGGFFFAAAWAYPRGMGMGDVKFAFVMGLFLGRAVAPALLTAFLVGTLVGGVIMARMGVEAGRKQKVPFGPFMAFGGVVGVFAGDAIMDWYVDRYFAS